MQKGDRVSIHIPGSGIDRDGRRQGVIVGESRDGKCWGVRYDDLKTVQTVAKSFCRPAGTPQQQSLTLTPAELDLVRQWFNAINDANPTFLEKADHALGERITEAVTANEPRPPLSNINPCPSCDRIFKDGETCTRGGCPMGGDF